MKIPTRPRQRGLRINMTPLIDCVFLLLIFFLLSSHLERSASREPVELPRAVEASEESDVVPRRLVVTVTRDGRLFAGGDAVPLEEIAQRIRAGYAEDGPDFQVRIRGDDGVPFEQVEPILLACAQAGVTKVAFAVLPQ